MKLHTDRSKGSLLVILSFCSAFLLTMQSVFFPLSKRIDFNDSAIYQYIGYLVTTGRTPYVDAFDHKGLYLYFINAIGYFINPKWGMWIVLWLSMAAAIIIVYIICAHFLNTLHSVLITVIIATGIAAGFWDGDTPDFFAMIWNLAAVCCLLSYFERDSLPRGKTVVIGMVTAVSFWMKQTLIIGTLTLCACIMAESACRKKWKLCLDDCVFFLSGFFVTSLPVILWLVKRNAFMAMIRDYFIFNFTYVGLHPTAMRITSAFVSFITTPSIFPVVPCILFQLLTMLKDLRKNKKASVDKMFLFGAISFVIALFFLILPGNAYVQYVMSLFPSALLIYISTLKKIGTADSAETKKETALLIAACVLIAGLNLRTENSYRRFFWKEKPQEIEERDYIIKNTEKADTIAIISPHYVGLYIAAGRDSATRECYVQLSHFEKLEESLNADMAFWNDYLNSLRQSRPRMILLDRHYYHNENLNMLLREILDQYIEVGKSTNFRFYVRERFEGEQIPAFVSKTTVLEDGVFISIPSEMIEAYQKGEITIDDFMTLFDKQVEDDRLF